MSKIRLVYSVDADDAFMFYALQHEEVDAEGLTFTHERADTAALNQQALTRQGDVIAVSAGAYPSVAADYLLLPHGASVGRGFGPVVVYKPNTTPSAAGGVVGNEKPRLEDFRGKRIAVPGETTTAYMVLRLMLEDFVPVTVPISPFSRVFEALDAGEVDAALLIHEGRLIFQEKGCESLGELGVWWQQRTNLPLPLGVNVIRKSLGPDLVKKVSRVVQRSIDWALDNRTRVIAAIAAEERGDASLGDDRLLDTYLGMYANEDTRGFSDDVRASLSALYAEAAAAGILPPGASVEWAP